MCHQIYIRQVSYESVSCRHCVFEFLESMSLVEIPGAIDRDKLLHLLPPGDPDLCILEISAVGEDLRIAWQFRCQPEGLVR